MTEKKYTPKINTMPYSKTMHHCPTQETAHKPYMKNTTDVLCINTHTPTCFNHLDDMHLSLSLTPFISITESGAIQWKSQAPKSVSFFSFSAFYCTSGMHTMFKDILQKWERNRRLKPLVCNSAHRLASCVCVILHAFMSVGWHVCALCRINNLDGSAAEEDTIQTWLK